MTEPPPQAKIKSGLYSFTVLETSLTKEISGLAPTPLASLDSILFSFSEVVTVL